LGALATTLCVCVRVEYCSTVVALARYRVKPPLASQRPTTLTNAPVERPLPMATVSLCSTHVVAVSSVAT
jgi:hypothetical protein